MPAPIEKGCVSILGQGVIKCQRFTKHPAKEAAHDINSENEPCNNESIFAKGNGGVAG
jgi:hypothetical protein